MQENQIKQWFATWRKKNGGLNEGTKKKTSGGMLDVETKH